MPDISSTLSLKKILLVGDYGLDDLLRVKQRLLELYPAAVIDLASVNKFDTRETSLLVAEAAESGRYDAIYHNTAPRLDKDEWTPTHGEPLAHATFTRADGKKTEIVGVASGNDVIGHAFGTLVERHYPAKLTAVRRVRHPSISSQFRSLEEFLVSFDKILRGDFSLLKEDITSAISPLINHATRDNAEFLKALEKAKADTKRDFHPFASRDLTRHGKLGERYVTVIAPEQDAVKQFAYIQESVGGDYELDTLPILYAEDAESYTIQAGFKLADLALNSANAETRTFFVPGFGTKDLAVVELLYQARLGNGATIVTDDPKTLGFVRDNIVSVHHDQRAGLFRGTGSITSGGHTRFFGERDFTPTQEEDSWWFPSDLDEVKSLIPEREPNLIATIDKYRNVKTSSLHSEVLAALEPQIKNAGHPFPLEDGKGAEVSVTTKGENGEKHQITAIVTTSSFRLGRGEIALSRGSSGRTEEGKKNYFAEIFQRDQEAWETLGRPKPGTKLQIVFTRLVDLPVPGTTINGTNREIKGLGSQTEREI